MKINTQKRKNVFKNVLLSLFICAFVFVSFAPAVHAATSTYFLCEVLATINVRRGPGLDYAIVTQYTAGTTFYGDVETYIVADGYKWYQCPDGYIAQTGGLRFYEKQVNYDYISGIDAYGDKRWEHDCEGTDRLNWGYHIEVAETSYTIKCDCGWWKLCGVSLPVNSETGESELIFVGLDTDNDEIVDLRPGQSKFLRNRADSDLRPYEILEFLDYPEKDTPTVTLHFCTYAPVELIKSYTFYWSVDVHVEDYGIVMVGQDGKEVIHYVDGAFLLYDKAMGVHLADTVRTYRTLEQYNGTEQIILKARHMEFIFTLEPPGEGEHGDFEHVINSVRDVFEALPNFFSNFGGLDSIFDEDSPLTDITSSDIFDGFGQVFELVRHFLLCLPTPILTIVSAIFILACVLGVYKLFHG